MNEHYRFMVNGVQMYPIYKQDTGIDYELEQSQVFFRKKLSSNLTFVGNDFLFILGQPFETKFTLILERWVDGAWKTELVGEFYKTDGKWDKVSQKVEISVDTIDDYKDVLAGMDKEFNIIELGVIKSDIASIKRPLLQIYALGDFSINNVIGGALWEKRLPDSVISRTDLKNIHGFTNGSNLFKLTVYSEDFDTAGVSGVYSGKNGVYINLDNNNYMVKYMGIIDQYELFDIIRLSDNKTMWKGQVTLTGDQIREKDKSSPNYPFDGRVLFSSVDQTHNYFVFADMEKYEMYSRYLTDVNTFEGNPTKPVPDNDFTDVQKHYAKIAPKTDDDIDISVRFSDTPTKWGKSSVSGRYYLPPSDDPLYQPIARNTWMESSIWSRNVLSIGYLRDEPKLRTPFLYKDCYSVGSVLSAILKKIAPNVVHENTIDGSKFLYDEANPITAKAMRVLISQKSNVVKGVYDLAAQRVPITLTDIFNLLRTAFKCYWHIENGKLKVEHVKYYMNGGSYDVDPVVGINLTTMLNKKNGKPWSFALNKYDYDKFDLPEQYKFAWMDTVSIGFAGVPINVKSKYVNVGKIEEVNASKYNPDVDYILSSPGEVSKEGYALFAPTFTTIEEVSSGNGYLSKTNGSVVVDASKRYKKYKIKTGYPILVTGSSNSGVVGVCFYDASGAFIGYENESTNYAKLNNMLVFVPYNCAYVGVNSANTVDQISISRILTLPIEQVVVAGLPLTIQNSYASWISLQKDFYTYDLPARLVEINGEETTATGVLRKKKQNVSFPWDGDIDTNKLIRTGLGDGKIDKISVSLSDRFVTATLKYEVDK